MSLSSFLLASADTVDSELDILFKDQTHSLQTEKQKAQSKKRRLAEHKSEFRSKKTKSGHSLTVKHDPSLKTKASSEEDEEKPDFEAVHLDLKQDTRQPAKDEEDNDDEEDDDSDTLRLVHESVMEKSESKHTSKKQKYVPPDETPAQRDQRTIFIGNLSLEVAQKRPLQKQLQRHILSSIPTARIESIRFRSVPFSSPASTTPNAFATEQSHENTSQREHSRARASSWRSSDMKDSNPDTDTKTYLSQNQKKKMLFLTHQFHPSATTVHAYILFAHLTPPSSIPRPENLPPLPDVMNPYEAAQCAVKNANSTEFAGRIIRVDFVGKSAGGNVRERNLEANKDADPKCTLFVGNLDLAAQEEDLRAFFENLMITERGDAPGAVDSTKKLSTWVTHVRIIRDKETQLGKGFAYVQFIDRECVDELLILQPTQLKFAKRKLRIQRCKTLPGAKLSSSVKSSLKILPSSSATASTIKPKKSQHQSISATPITVPKGDPSLGTRLASMSKQDRKAAKLADADRVARRLAKKKARMAMSTKKDLASVESGRGRGEKRVRVRVRKDGVKAKGAQGAKKVRVRSEKSLQKRNVKK